MKKFIIPLVLIFLFVAMLSVPAMANPITAPVPMPAGTASPRDWSKLTRADGSLLPSSVVADSAILIDSQTGKVLFEKNADVKHFPASITKVMTCLIALDSKKDLSGIVTIGKLPSLEAGAETIDLKEGETLTLENLLYGLMLMSGNDAANAIAIYIAGSVEAFNELMNAKAKEIGMTNTHYMNPNGLDNPKHYTTARDMAILTKTAYSYPMFVKLVSTLNYVMPSTNMHGNARAWKNHNLLIDTSKSNVYYYEYATGVKTGYTYSAQSTLISSAQKGNVKLIAVVLHDGKIPKWTDSITMFEYGFNFFDTLDLKQLLGSQTLTTDIKNADANDPGQGRLALVMLPKSSNTCITDSKDKIAQLMNDPSQFQQTMSLTKDTAPIRKDEAIGTVTFTYSGASVLTCDLLAARDVNGSNSGSASDTDNSAAVLGKNDGAGSILAWLVVFILLLIFALATIRFVNIRRRSQLHHQYSYRVSHGSKHR